MLHLAFLSRVHPSHVWEISQNPSPVFLTMWIPHSIKGNWGQRSLPTLQNQMGFSPMWVVPCTQKYLSQVPVAHACNPSYPGGRDHEDHGLKPPWKSTPGDPILKESFIKNGCWSDSRWRPWVLIPIRVKDYRYVPPRICFVHLKYVPPLQVSWEFLFSCACKLP
jgi:hypothetical protein